MKLPKFGKSDSNDRTPQDRPLIKTVLAMVIAVGGLIQAGQAVGDVAKSPTVQHIVRSRFIEDVEQHL